MVILGKAKKQLSPKVARQVHQAKQSFPNSEHPFMKRLILLIVCVLISGDCVTHAQQSPLDAMLRTRPPQVEDWAWINQPWTGDSAPYLRVKRRIDAAFTNKKRIEAVTQEYRVAAQANPLDPLAEYAWGYAAYAARPLGAPIRGQEIPKIAVALSLPQFPKTYEFARLRFAITVHWRPYSQLKALGYRLLQRNANDYDVKRGMVDILVAGSKVEQQQSFKYAQQLVYEYPKQTNSYTSLAWVYDTRFALYKDVSSGDKAIAAYRKAIALSKSPIGRQNVEHNIHRIQQEQKQLRAKG